MNHKELLVYTNILIVMYLVSILQVLCEIKLNFWVAVIINTLAAALSAFLLREEQ